MLALKSIRCIFADMIYSLCTASEKNRIDADVERNLKWDAKRDRIKGNVMRLNYLLLIKAEFRSIFYFRAKKHRFLTALCKAFLPCPDTIEFGDGDMGGGILVSHYHSVVCPQKTGANFRVGPGAVIESDISGGPEFGNNVYVASNSVVVGNINIGDNVIIGGGSVVTEDLPGNGVYVGNPARFIKHIDGNEALLNEIM